MSKPDEKYLVRELSKEYIPATGSRIRELLSNQGKRARRLKAEEKWTQIARTDETRARSEQAAFRRRAADAKAAQKVGLDTQLTEKRLQQEHEAEEKRRLAAATEALVQTYKEDEQQSKAQRRDKVQAEKQRMRDQMEDSIARRAQARDKEKQEALAYVRRVADELSTLKGKESEKRRSGRAALLRTIADEKLRMEACEQQRREAALQEQQTLGASQLHALHEAETKRKRAATIQERMDRNTEYFLKNRVASWDELAARDEVRAHHQQMEMARKEDESKQRRLELREVEKCSRLQVLQQQVDEKRLRREQEKEEARKRRAALIEGEKRALSHELAVRFQAKRDAATRCASLDMQLQQRCQRETLPLETRIHSTPPKREPKEEGVR